MSTLPAFAIELESLAGRPTNLRPFVCSGSPLECSVFIFGFNPATEMGSDFWDYWRPEHGFDKAAWFESYQNERLSRRLKPGKTRRSRVSNTRRVIEWIIEAASPVRCLETNIYPAATAQAIELTDDHRRTDVFSFLLTAIRPKIVVAHGKDAEIAICRHCVDGATLVIAKTHFSRG